VSDLGAETVLVRETDPDLEIDPARATVPASASDLAVVIVRALVIDPGAEIDRASAIDLVLEIDPVVVIGLGLETDRESVIVLVVGGQVLATARAAVTDLVVVVLVSEIGREVVIDLTDQVVEIDREVATGLVVIAPVGPALVDLALVTDLAGGTGLEIVLVAAIGRESAIDQAGIVLALAIGRISTGRRTTDRFGAIAPTATGTMAGGGVGTIRGIAGGIAVAGL
jgi:hypothetical protein